MRNNKSINSTDYINFPQAYQSTAINTNIKEENEDYESEKASLLN